MPPTKSIRLSVRRSPTFSSGSSTARCSTSTSSARRAASRRPAPAAQACASGPPGTSTPARATVRRGRSGAGPRCSRARVAARSDSGVSPAEIPDDAVVRQDADLIVGKRHGDERARRPWCRLPVAARAQSVARARRSRHGDGRRRCTCAGTSRTRRTSASRSAPVTRQIVWRTPSGARQIVERRPPSARARRSRRPQATRAIGQEHDAGLRAQLDHVPRPIVFLVLARLLVLLDRDSVSYSSSEKQPARPVCSCAPIVSR